MRFGAHPADPPRSEPVGEHRVQRVQVAHVRGGVRELGRGQRAPLPRGPLLILAERGPEQVVGEVREPDLVTDPGERRHQLGIDQARHLGEPVSGGEQREILTRCMRDHVGMGRQRRDHRGRIAAQRIEQPDRRLDRDDLRGRGIEHPVLCFIDPRDLQQAEPWSESICRGELEVECDAGCPGDARRHVADVRRFGDQIHSHIILCPARFARGLP